MGEPAGGATASLPTGEPASRADRLEIRISGSGGQGILLAAAALADAVAASGREVVQTQSYGPEARGGASQAEVIASTGPIDYPEVDLADVSLCLSQAAFDKYGRLGREGALLIYDSDLVDEGDISGFRLVGLPLTRTATSGVGAKVVANIVALGALTAFVEWLPTDVVDAAVASRVPERFKELNGRALEAGRRLVELAEAGVAVEGVESDKLPGSARAGERAEAGEPGLPTTAEMQLGEAPCEPSGDEG